jgi:flagellar motor switch protein FliG
VAGDRLVSAEVLSGVEKAAVLLLSLGPEAASQVLMRLDGDEVRRVSQALARAREVSAGQVEQVAEDFRSKLGTPSSLSVNGRAFARAVVTKALADPSSAAAGARGEILADLEHASAASGTDLTKAIEGVPPDGIAKLLESEHPQIAALILAYLGADRAMEILGHLPEALQGEMIERLARLDSAVPASVVAQVGSMLRDQLQGFVRESGTIPGGPKVAAEILKHADKTTEARIFETLDQHDAELAAAIRGQLFTFEDLIKLDNRGMQALLKEVAREDLLLGLKTASPELSQKIFANISSRAAEILREDLETAGPARLADVEEAQSKIVATMRELEADGKIVLASTGEALV